MGFFQKIVSLFITFICMIAFAGSATKPEIKEGEFDFVLTYEVDGEIGTIEGTYVCKFEKVEYYLDGINRKWTGYIKGHENSNCYVLKTIDGVMVKVDLDLNPQFFMSDPHYKSNINSDEPKPEPYLYISTSTDDENEYKFNYYEGNDVKIISLEYDAPIENTYK